jgi:hypothetical protein
MKAKIKDGCIKMSKMVAMIARNVLEMQRRWLPLFAKNMVACSSFSPRNRELNCKGRK